MHTSLDLAHCIAEDDSELLSLCLLSAGIIGMYHLCGAWEQTQGVCIGGKHSPNGYIFNPILKYLTMFLNLGFLTGFSPL